MIFKVTPNLTSTDKVTHRICEKRLGTSSYSVVRDLDFILLVNNLGGSVPGGGSYVTPPRGKEKVRS